MFDLNALNEEEKFALLFGIMLGDGCLSFVKRRKKFVVITGSLKDDLPFFKKVVLPLLKQFRGRDINIKFRYNTGAIDFNFVSKKLFDFIHSYGFPVGKKGPNLTIPEFFYKKNLLRQVVQGFVATDGSLVLTKNPNKFYPRIEAKVISKNLLRQIYDYLVLLGMRGNFYKSKSKPDPRWNVVQDAYRFQFNGKENLLLFNKLIGFVNPKHEARFTKFLVYDKEYNEAIKGVAPKNVLSVVGDINSSFLVQ